MGKSKTSASATAAEPAAASTANGKRKGTKHKRAEADAADVAKATAEVAAAAQAMAIEEDEPAEVDDGPTLGQRAAALARSDSDASGSGDERGGGTGASGRNMDAGTGAADFPAELAGRARGDSVVMLLKQALRGEDSALLQQCLAVDDERVIKATVRALASDEVLVLLQLLAQRLQSVQPGNKHSLLWAQHTLTQHAGYVASAPGLQPVLSSLYATIQQRLATLPALLSLQGRINLLLAQAGDADDEGGPNAQPLVYYEESASDDDQVAVEDPYAPHLEEVSEEGDESSDVDSLLSEGDDMDGDFSD